MGVTAIVLAAGEGTRMKSARPKVVHEVLGRPMVSWVVEAARAAGVERTVVVVGNGADQVRALFAQDADVECVLQEQRLGTGHAVRAALEQTQVADGQVLVLCGDTPLLRAETLKSLVEAACAPQHKAGALLTMTYDDPTGYGRVMVEGGIATQIVEQKDCTPQQAQVKTCNAGVYCFDAQLLAAHIGELSCENAQHEFYLTDMVGILRAHGAAMAAVDCADADELMGVNSRIQLAQATRAMQERINRAHMAAGVTMLDPTQVWIGPDVQIGRDTEILPGTMLWGKTVVGQNCVLGPQTRLTDTRVGDGCVLDETVAVEAVLESDVSCGPRAYLRPGAHLLDGAKAGTHVEIKKSTVGKGSKVPHLSYIGDCTIGEGVNIGAGTITCNYDGKNKHATTIGDGTFIGSDTMLVAPVNIGANCTVGAGSTITKDVPDGSLALERSEQKMKAGWRPKWDRG